MAIFSGPAAPPPPAPSGPNARRVPSARRPRRALCPAASGAAASASAMPTPQRASASRPRGRRGVPASRSPSQTFPWHGIETLRATPCIAFAQKPNHRGRARRRLIWGQSAPEGGRDHDRARYVSSRRGDPAGPLIREREMKTETGTFPTVSKAQASFVYSGIQLLTSLSTTARCASAVWDARRPTPSVSPP
ncbi:hypothetical protein B0H15DRAFT_947919 [Mycena belliarum]|uniref:Uncharacterized protein n=1 Tax=Mycena belliarum TaxID=1033014 RepID=A0AAD6U7Y6_9AGAR|nr:hypothetical protein B0H15DRAFT_947919 [Mycena belliae]